MRGTAPSLVGRQGREETGAVSLAARKQPDLHGCCMPRSPKPPYWPPTQGCSIRRHRARFPVTSHSFRPGPAAWRRRGCPWPRPCFKHLLGHVSDDHAVGPDTKRSGRPLVRPRSVETWDSWDPRDSIRCAGFGEKHSRGPSPGSSRDGPPIPFPAWPSQPGAPSPNTSHALQTQKAAVGPKKYPAPIVSPIPVCLTESNLRTAVVKRGWVSLTSRAE